MAAVVWLAARECPRKLRSGTQQLPVSLDRARSQRPGRYSIRRRPACRDPSALQRRSEPPERPAARCDWPLVQLPTPFPLEHSNSAIFERQRPPALRAQQARRGRPGRSGDHEEPGRAPHLQPDSQQRPLRGQAHNPLQPRLPRLQADTGAPRGARGRSAATPPGRAAPPSPSRAAGSVEMPPIGVRARPAHAWAPPRRRTA